ncbi:unnamed protein product [Musa acuminata subsp. malaccensis]|uniref:(wild Malaysian banana) hypothetical protein n=1 Tax=Musa acuminata subsp. malaccensis TaxID=214687 RepID=A0A804JD62_MUSAM|nr:unnamed protein product [Musa acuminata subsp. malaccensis]
MLISWDPTLLNACGLHIGNGRTVLFCSESETFLGCFLRFAEVISMGSSACWTFAIVLLFPDCWACMLGCF